MCPDKNTSCKGFITALILIGAFLLATLGALGQSPEDQLATHFRAGQEALRQGEFARATEEFRKVLALDPTLLEAEVNLGNILLNGRAVPKDAARAVVLYKKAELQNNSAALNNLGTCYEQGTGVEKDVNRAIIYFKRAAAAGSADGVANLKRLGK